MFRENVLVRDDVIARISETMVPVALDYQVVLNRQSREARFLLPLMNEKGDRQGIWLFSPEGKVLGRGVGFGNMAEKTMRLMGQAMQEFGPVEPRRISAANLNFDRGAGFRPDGSVRLAQYVRRRDQSNISSPVIASAVLSRKEFLAFAPRHMKLGEEWTVPDAIARKLCRIVSPMCYQHAPRPDWVEGVELTAEIVSINGQRINVTYRGKMSARRLLKGKVFSRQKVELLGHGTYDKLQRQMLELLIGGSGTFVWLQDDLDPVQFDALVEWYGRPDGFPATK